MGLRYHPNRGKVVLVDFDQTFREPEMVKKRLGIVISPAIVGRPRLCTIVPLSSTAPNPVQSYHYNLDIPFQLPSRWRNRDLWIKGDMIYALSFDRINLIRTGRDQNGKRNYQLRTLSNQHMQAISNCLKSALGL